MFRSKLTLQGDCFSRIRVTDWNGRRVARQVPLATAIRRIYADENTLALTPTLSHRRGSQLMIVENPEPAAGYQRRHIAAGEAQVRIGRPE